MPARKACVNVELVPPGLASCPTSFLLCNAVRRSVSASPVTTSGAKTVSSIHLAFREGRYRRLRTLWQVTCGQTLRCWILHVQSKMMDKQLHTMLCAPQTLGPVTMLFEDGRVQFDSNIFVGEIRTQGLFRMLIGDIQAKD